MSIRQVFGTVLAIGVGLVSDASVARDCRSLFVTDSSRLSGLFGLSMVASELWKPIKPQRSIPTVFPVFEGPQNVSFPNQSPSHVSFDGLASVDPTRATWSAPKANVKVKQDTDHQPPVTTIRMNARTKGPHIISMNESLIPRNVPLFIVPRLVSPGSSFDLVRFFSTFGYSTGVAFQISSPTPGAEVTLFVSHPTMKNVLLHKFKVPNQPAYVRIPWSDFQSYDRAEIERVFGEGLPARDLEGASGPQPHIGFMVESSRVEIQLSGHIFFERDIESSPQVRDIISQISNFGLQELGSKLNFQIHIDGQQVMKDAIQNLYARKNQDYALDILQQGERAVLRKLEELGFGHHVLSEKVNVGFFEHPGLNYLYEYDSRQILRTPKPNPIPIVPIETGVFGKDHGEWSHALQVIAMTAGFSKMELEAFRRIYGSMFLTDSSPGWAIWDAVFDAPGNFSANSPRWWRDQVRLRKEFR